jgi:hypothetical protein
MIEKKPSIDVLYEQWCEDFRSINDIFWRLPTIAMTVTGGVAVAIGSLQLTDFTVKSLLLFGSLCNVFLIFAAWRLRRGVMSELLSKIHAAESDLAPKFYPVLSSL